MSRTWFDKHLPIAVAVFKSIMRCLGNYFEEVVIMISRLIIFHMIINRLEFCQNLGTQDVKANTSTKH